MSYNNRSAQRKQTNPGYLRQYKNPGQDVSRKNGMYGHPKYAVKSSECRDAAVHNKNDKSNKSSINYLSVLLWNSIQSGMILPYGCTGGLPDIAKMSFWKEVLVSLSRISVLGLQSSGDVHQALGDWYTLAAYCLD